MYSILQKYLTTSGFKVEKLLLRISKNLKLIKSISEFNSILIILLLEAKIRVMLSKFPGNIRCEMLFDSIFISIKEITVECGIEGVTFNRRDEQFVTCILLIWRS